MPEQPAEVPESITEGITGCEWEGYCHAKNAAEIIETLETMVDNSNLMERLTGEDQSTELLRGLAETDDIDKVLEVCRLGLDHEDEKVRHLVALYLTMKVACEATPHESMPLIEKAASDESPLVSEVVFETIEEYSYENGVVRPEVALGIARLAKRHGIALEG